MSVTDPYDEKTSTLTLAKPIEWGAETIEKLTFREPTGADIESLPLGTVTAGDYVRIAARLTAQPYEALLRASAKDTLLICGAVERQLSGGPPTGET
ncbi:MAG: phage tail assembly protein [Planctomycetota bacterium]